jgi:hypothetical protein
LAKQPLTTGQVDKDKNMAFGEGTRHGGGTREMQEDLVLRVASTRSRPKLNVVSHTARYRTRSGIARGLDRRTMRAPASRVRRRPFGDGSFMPRDEGQLAVQYIEQGVRLKGKAQENVCSAQACVAKRPASSRCEECLVWSHYKQSGPSPTQSLVDAYLIRDVTASLPSSHSYNAYS